LQILLPCDTFGLFQLFVLDQNKKVVTILDPLPIPGMGKNIFKTMVKNLNHSLRHANPAFNEDLFKWGCKVPVVPTNSNGYGSCQCITIFNDSTHNLTFQTCSALSGYLVFNFMHSWYDGVFHFPIPMVSIYNMRIFISDTFDFFIISLYNPYVG
jgi:hypothetical protein